MQSLKGIGEIINKYEVFILDQWGVMHDGNKAYSNAIKCIDYLKANNKKLIIISNSSKRKKSSIYFMSYPIKSRGALTNRQLSVN